MRKFKLFSYLLIAGMLFSNANMYAMEGQNQNLGNEENRHDGREIVAVGNVRYDCAFKEVFKQVDILSDLLNSIYGFNMSDEDGLRIRNIVFDNDTSSSATSSSVNVFFDVKCTCIVAKNDADANKLVGILSSAKKNSITAKNFEKSGVDVYFFDIEMQRSAQNAFVDRSLLHNSVEQKEGYDKFANIVETNNHNDKFQFGIPNTRVLSFLSFCLKDIMGNFINENKIFLHAAPFIMSGGTLQNGDLVLDENSVTKIASNKQLITYVQLPVAAQFYENVTLRDSYEYRELWTKFLSGSNNDTYVYEVDKSEYRSSAVITKAIDTLYKYQMSPEGRHALLVAAENERIFKENLSKSYSDGIEQGRQEGAMIERKKDVVHKLAKRHTAEDFATKRQKLLEDGRYNAIEIQGFISEQNFEYYKENNFDFDQITKELKLSAQKEQEQEPKQDESKSLPTSTK